MVVQNRFDVFDRFRTTTGEFSATDAATDATDNTPTTGTDDDSNPDGPDAGGGGAQNLRFPQDIETIGHWVNFTIFEYSRASRQQQQAQPGSIIGHITLPLPANLETAYNADYSNERMGMYEAVLGEFGGTLLGGDKPENKVPSSVRKLTQNLKQSEISSFADKLTEFGGNAAKAVTDMIPAWGLDTFDSAGALSQSLGLARNPHLAAIYKGTRFRDHSFSYSLTARNQQESQTLNQIIKAFKLAQAPGFNRERFENHLFKYPDEFSISFCHPEFLFSIGPSVLRNFSINYHGQGVPAYFQETNAPVSITLTLNFQEVNIVTKETIEQFNR